MKLIAAIDENWNIGKNDKLLFHISEDMKSFKNLTTGNTVILGRKTLDTFPNSKPLKNRQNIILTNNKSFTAEGAIICTSVADVLNEVNKCDGNNVYVIGGESVYNQFLNYCDTAIITKVFESVADADKRMENLDNNKNWELNYQSEIKEENNLKYCFCTYKKLVSISD